MKAYKLTDKDDRTYGGCQWGKNVTHKASGKGGLCTSGWIHYYSDPVLALFLDPLHGNFGATAHLWEVEVSGETKDDRGLKFGAMELTTVRRLRKKRITTEHRIRFAILCAQEVCHGKAWNKWADAWLDGTDRTTAAANAAYAATDAATYVAYNASAAAAASASYAAAYAATSSAAYAATSSAAYAATSAAAYAATSSAAYAASSAAATRAAAAASSAAAYAAAATDIDLIAIARRAIGGGDMNGKNRI